MLNNEKRMIQIDGEKPVEMMTNEERDAYFIDLFNMTYAEFLEEHKDDTVESIMYDTFKNAKYV